MNNTIINAINWNNNYYEFWKNLKLIFTSDKRFAEELKDIFTDLIETDNFSNNDINTYQTYINSFEQLEELYAYFSFAYKVFNNMTYKETIFINILWYRSDHNNQLVKDYNNLIKDIEDYTYSNNKKEEYITMINKYLLDYLPSYNNNQVDIGYIDNYRQNETIQNCHIRWKINNVAFDTISKKITENKDLENYTEAFDCFNFVEEWWWTMVKDIYKKHLNWREILSLMVAFNTIKITQYDSVNILIYNKIEDDVRIISKEINDDYVSQLLQKYFWKY